MFINPIFNPFLSTSVTFLYTSITVSILMWVQTALCVVLCMTAVAKAFGDSQHPSVVLVPLVHIYYYFYLFSRPSTVKQVENLVHIPAVCSRAPCFPPISPSKGNNACFHISSNHPVAELGEQRQVLNPTVFPFTRKLKSS